QVDGRQKLRLSLRFSTHGSLTLPLRQYSNLSGVFQQTVSGHREQATNTCVGRRWKAKFFTLNSRQFPATISRTNVLTPCPGWGNYHSGHQKQTMEITMSTTGSASKNVLNSDVEIKGNIKFSGELTFDGKLDGEIHTDGTLHLGDGAVINGNVNATNVVVRGKVNGNVTAKEKIDIKARTELFG